MKIFLLSPSVRALGARRSLVELVKKLPSHVEPFVACPNRGGIAQELEEMGVSVGYAPQGAWRKAQGRLVSIFLQLPKLRKMVRQFQPDLLHGNEFHILPQAVIASGGILPVTGHVRLGLTPRQFKNYKIPQCQRIIAVSEAVRSLFPTDYRERVDVIYNGVDLGKITQTTSPLGKVQQWREESRLVVGLLGLVSPRKNQLLAAEAVARANAAGAKISILFAGDPFKSTETYGDELRARLSEPDLRDCSLWVPFQDDIAQLYRSMDLNLLISSEEGFGRTIIEAGALGIPSLGTRIGGIPELLGPASEGGWLIKDGDNDGLAALLGEIAQQPHQLKTKGAAMETRVKEHFTIEAHVGNMVRFWEKVIAEK